MNNEEKRISLSQILDVRTASILTPMTCRIKYLDEDGQIKKVFFAPSIFLTFEDMGAKLGIKRK